MKRTNNKFRSNNNGNNNNNNNQIYSLNYKFDSCSIAGKCSGTALDLIKKYNELAKEAQSNSDYTSAEVFRQYAEHYRKIVTDINEKKNQRNAAAARRDDRNEDNSCNSNNISNDNANAVCSEQNQNIEVENCVDENSQNEIISENNMNNNEEVKSVETETPAPKKSFKVVEISSADAKSELIDANESKPKRVIRRKAAAAC